MINYLQYYVPEIELSSVNIETIICPDGGKYLWSPPIFGWEGGFGGKENFITLPWLVIHNKNLPINRNHRRSDSPRISIIYQEVARHQPWVSTTRILEYFNRDSHNISFLWNTHRHILHLRCVQNTVYSTFLNILDDSRTWNQYCHSYHDIFQYYNCEAPNWILQTRNSDFFRQVHNFKIREIWDDTEHDGLDMSIDICVSGTSPIGVPQIRVLFNVLLFIQNWWWDWAEIGIKKIEVSCLQAHETYHYPSFCCSLDFLYLLCNWLPLLFALRVVLSCQSMAHQLSLFTVL